MNRWPVHSVCTRARAHTRVCHSSASHLGAPPFAQRPSGAVLQARSWLADAPGSSCSGAPRGTARDWHLPKWLRCAQMAPLHCTAGLQNTVCACVRVRVWLCVCVCVASECTLCGGRRMGGALRLSPAERSNSGGLVGSWARVFTRQTLPIPGAAGVHHVIRNCPAAARLCAPCIPQRIFCVVLAPPTPPSPSAQPTAPRPRAQSSREGH